MERLEPIHVMEYRFRRQGVFLLVDVDGRRVWFYGFKKDFVAINQMMESLKGWVPEMVKFLIARTRAKG